MLNGYVNRNALIDLLHGLTYTKVFRRGIWNIPSGIPVDFPHHAQLEQHIYSPSWDAQSPSTN